MKVLDREDAKVYALLPEEYMQGEITLHSGDKVYVNEQNPKIALFYDESRHNYRVFVVEELRNASNVSSQEMELEYCVLQKKAESDILSKQELAEEYVKFFESISKEDKAKADEYAVLLRKIVGDGCEFADEEVFEVAEACVKFFEKMAEGYDDFGVLDIVVNKDNDGKYSIGFEYFGEVRAYSVERMEDGKTVNVTFYDAKPSKAFLEKYSFQETHQISGLTFRAEYNADHGFHIYISGDSVSDIEEKSTTTVKCPVGMINILR